MTRITPSRDAGRANARGQDPKPAVKKTCALRARTGTRQVTRATATTNGHCYAAFLCLLTRRSASLMVFALPDNHMRRISAISNTFSGRSGKNSGKQPA